jgi:hypothetical protein
MASSKEEALIGKEARPWRELRGLLLRSAREPDPCGWVLGAQQRGKALVKADANAWVL